MVDGNDADVKLMMVDVSGTATKSKPPISMLASRVTSRRDQETKEVDDPAAVKVSPTVKTGNDEAANVQNLCKQLKAEVSFFARVGLLEHSGGKFCRLGPLIYAACSIPYWRGYSISMEAAIVTAGALSVVLMAWASAANTASTVGMKLLLKHLNMPHAKKKTHGTTSVNALIDLEFAGELAGSEMTSLVQGPEVKHAIGETLGIMKFYNDVFYQSCFGNFVLLAIWCFQASMKYNAGSWGQILCLAAIPLGSATYPPVCAQLILGSAVLEMTSVLICADVDSLRDAVATSLLDKGLGPHQQLAHIDGALRGIRGRMEVLNKIWGKSAAVFLAALLLLEALYLLVAFGAPGSVTWYGRSCLVFLSLFPACGLVIVLKYMGRPADRWARHFTIDLSTAQITFEAQRLFLDGGSFRGILKGRN